MDVREPVVSPDDKVNVVPVAFVKDMLVEVTFVARKAPVLTLLVATSEPVVMSLAVIVPLVILDDTRFVKVAFVDES